MQRPPWRGALFVAGIGALAAPLGCEEPTYINEFPHARVAVHAHPHAGESLSLALTQQALTQHVHELELDLHMRGTELVADHDGAQASSPTVKSIFDQILAYRGANATVQNDGRQFIVVLEPKDDQANLYAALHDLLVQYEPHLSTAVGATDAPRGITAVITGDYRQKVYDAYASTDLNKLAIVEDHDYSAQITNLAPGKPSFQWSAIAIDDLAGRTNARHQAGFNVRAYYDSSPSGDDARLALASGVDSLNCDFSAITFCQQVLASQQPLGHSPTLAMRNGKALLSWRGNTSNNVYVALGTSGPDGLAFPRQINMTYLLADEPLAIAPSATLTNDGRLVDVYEGTSAHRLWFVSGAFTSLDRFVTFAGGEQRITLPNDAGRLGSNPSVAVSPSGRMVSVYEGTSDQKLWYVTGTLNPDGTYTANEQSLTQGDSRRGYTPSIAFDANGRVVVVYRGTDNARLFYVSGTLDANGNIVGSEFRLTDPNENRRGYTPSIAIRSDGVVVVTYQGTSDQKIWFSYGTLTPSGAIAVQAESLLVDAAGTTVHGSHPTAAFDEAGRLTILYEGTDGGRLFYVAGPLDWATGRIGGYERRLDMSLGDGL